ncbi:MAG: hypothetical protein IPG66_16990 [Hydrogenophilales bacterium]|nr:hypothetical protein [Hydrogenophilales bacterium]
MMLFIRLEKWLQAPWRVFFLYGLFTLLWAPALVMAPRFWAEDGNVYYLQARAVDAWDALLGMPLGYLSLPANLAGVISAKLPLLYAPYGGFFVSLAIQMGLLWVIMANRYFDGRPLWQGALALIPVVLVQSFETWLNAINSQFWLALAAALVLAAPGGTFTPGRHSVNGLVLILAGLSGPVSAFLAPLFVLRAIHERRWHWGLYALPVSIGALLVIFVAPSGGRVLSFPLDIFALSAAFQLFLNNFCIECARTVWAQAYELQPYADLFLLGVLLVYGGLFVRADRLGRWLLVASFLLLCLSFVGMLGKEGLLGVPTYSNSRYFFVPAALLFAAVLSGYAQGRRWLGGVLLLFVLNGLYFGAEYRVVGEKDGKHWKRSVRAYESGRESVVYFNRPLCAFVPDRKAGALSPPVLSAGTATELVFGVPENIPKDARNIYLFRFTEDEPHVFQKHMGEWQISQLFLTGVPALGHCYGGDIADPVRWAQIQNGQLYVDRSELGPLSGHSYLLGYGENMAAMLAHGSFMRFNGSELAARVPEVDEASDNAASAKRIFSPAEIDGIALDLCAGWGWNCGIPAADAFCKSMGFDFALSYDTRLDTPPTRIISTGELCQEATCDRIASVTCITGGPWGGGD